MQRIVVLWRASERDGVGNSGRDEEGGVGGEREGVGNRGRDEEGGVGKT